MGSLIRRVKTYVKNVTDDVFGKRAAGRGLTVYPDDVFRSFLLEVQAATPGPDSFFGKPGSGRTHHVLRMVKTVSCR